MNTERAEWTRGVLTTSSWHKFEELAAMMNADDMIREGERSGGWPIGLRFAALRTEGGLIVPAKGLVASYQHHPEQCLSVVGDKYRATTPDEWRGLVRAACDAGAKPTGCFSLRDGTRMLATFEVGQTNGTITFLNIMDTLDGSSQLMCGATVVRTVCANTVASWIRTDGDGIAKLRHTASLEQKVAVLGDSIGKAIKSGEKVRDLYHAAEDIRFTKADALATLDLLFPEASEEVKAAQDSKDPTIAGAAKRAVTVAKKARAEAVMAMNRPVNNVKNTLATVWNAATWLVDRQPVTTGSVADDTFRDTGKEVFRKTRGGDALESLLFGSRAKRIEQIQTVVEVIMRDGTVRPMHVAEALAAGVDPKLTGAALLQDLIDNPPTDA